jgi:hypothetical protein
MTRNLKALGLALVAVFAMSAVAAANASATSATFSWGEGATKIMTAADPTSPSQELTITPGAITSSFTCDEVSGSATISGSGASSITGQNISYSDSGTTPEKEVCTGKVNGIAVKTPIKFNGCDYNFIAGTTVGELAEGIAEGTIEIKCPEGKVIEISAAGCLAKISPQIIGRVLWTTVKTTGQLSDITGHTEVGLTAGQHNNAIDYSTSGFTCGVHSETDGTYKGTFTITAAVADGTSTRSNIT